MVGLNCQVPNGTEECGTEIELKGIFGTTTAAFVVLRDLNNVQTWLAEEPFLCWIKYCSKFVPFEMARVLL